MHMTKLETPMSMTREQLKLHAMQLDPIEREALAEELLLSIDDTARADIDNAWLAEAHRRNTLSQQRPAALKAVEDVLHRLQKKAGA
jgi:hypothetical protein